MRPVNLLPARHKPRGPSGGRKGGGYVVLGVLGALLLGVLLYVVTANQVTSRKDQLVEVREEAQRAEAQAASLRAFGSFSQVKQTRVSSVRDLASGRFDWERLSRELAHVFPAGVWLKQLTASARPEETSAPSAEDAPKGPSLKLLGCARRTPDVAVTLVRLRRLHRAEDVRLTESARPEGGGGSSGAPAAGSGGGGNEECGTTRGRQNYRFEVTVVFTQTPSAEHGRGAPTRVPSSLGGGS